MSYDPEQTPAGAALEPLSEPLRLVQPRTQPGGQQDAQGLLKAARQALREGKARMRELEAEIARFEADLVEPPHDQDPPRMPLNIWREQQPARPVPIERGRLLRDARSGVRSLWGEE
jgi:hypothetical protein